MIGRATKIQLCWMTSSTVDLHKRKYLVYVLASVGSMILFRRTPIENGSPYRIARHRNSRHPERVRFLEIEAIIFTEQGFCCNPSDFVTRLHFTLHLQHRP
jgi:hypothetical protein